MHDHEDIPKKSRHDRLILLGNPNVGKSVIFGLLSGRYVTVSNYPGTTVEVSRANITLGDHRYLLVDTPGTNSLIPMSEDERVTRDILLEESPRAVVQVSDAKNPKRTLNLALQAADLGLPYVLVLNMADEARTRGIATDRQRLAEILGIDVIETVAPERRGIGTLKNTIPKARRPVFRVDYGETIEKAIATIAALLPDDEIRRRAISIMLLTGDESLHLWALEHLGEQGLAVVERMREDAQRRLDRPLAAVMSTERAKAVEQIYTQVVSKTPPVGGRVANTFGRLSTHPVWGVPILLAILYLVWKFVGDFGAGTTVDFLQQNLFERYITPWAGRLADLIPIAFLRDLLVGPYGLVTMALTYAIAIILPITAFFFLAFGILEDSGYLPRLAIMTNRIFRVMGLNGKAVLPLILGLGCDTMATMTTRILETRRERVIATFLLALAIPCSAQLGVVMGMLAAVSWGVTAVWIGTLVGTILLTGWLGSKVLPGDRSDFFMEIPPIRVPRIQNILLKTLGRIEWYLREAVPLFVLGTLVLFVLDRTQLLGALRHATAPLVVGFLGLPDEATDALLMGFLRRDYGAAGFFELFKAGMLDPVQVAVSLVTITLFVPCLANLFMMIKERGARTALLMTAMIFPFAIVVGGLLNFTLRTLGVTF